MVTLLIILIRNGRAFLEKLYLLNMYIHIPLEWVLIYTNMENFKRGFERGLDGRHIDY